MENDYKDLSVNKDELSNVLQHMGLLEEGQSFTVQPLTGGVSSNILKICVNNKEFCIKQALPKLKVSKEWYAPLDRVFAEIDWLSIASQITPNAVPQVLGVDKQARCFAMSYLPKNTYNNWKEKLLQGEVDINTAKLLGNILVKLHSATSNNSHYAKQFAFDDSFYALRLEPYLLETAKANPTLSDKIISILERTQTQKLALVHGDISPKNILLGPYGPVILDAECAWYGDPAFDLAFCLNHMLLKAVLMPNHIDQLMNAYTLMSDAYLAGITWENITDFESRVATLLPCLTLARVDGKSTAEYLNDQHSQHIRQVTSELIKNGTDRLATINTIWKKEIVK